MGYGNVVGGTMTAHSRSKTIQRGVNTMKYLTRKQLVELAERDKQEAYEREVWGLLKMKVMQVGCIARWKSKKLGVQCIRNRTWDLEWELRNANTGEYISAGSEKEAQAILNKWLKR